jgi:membrane protein required for colicin V production
VSALDITLIVIIALSTVLSARKGFSREIIGLAAALLGLLLATQFYRVAGEPLRPYVSGDSFAWLAGFLMVFFGVLIVGALLSAVVSRFLGAIGLSFIDRLLGAVFGLIRGALIAIGIILTLVAFTSSQAVVQSRVAPYLIEVSRLVAKVAPQELKDSFQRRYEQVKLSWQTAAENK